MKSTIKKWENRLADTSTPWSENDIIYFRKAIGSSGIRDADTRGYLLMTFERHEPGYRIFPDHDQKGRDYMLAKSLKKDGTKRAGCKLGDREIDIMKGLDYHLFFGLYRPQAHLDYFLPIYRAVAIDGRFFDYVGAAYEMVVVLR